LQYALSAAGEVYNCPSFYKLQRFSQDLKEQDQVSSMLHEFTHLGGIYFPPTRDKKYIHEEVVALSTIDALENAQSYAFYA
ncbi:hypothetical protein BGX38DRAFT_1058735, partial [Terfezia claveryi]